MPLSPLTLLALGLSVAHAQELSGGAAPADDAPLPAAAATGDTQPAADPAAAAPASEGAVTAATAAPADPLTNPTVASPAAAPAPLVPVGLTAERLTLLRTYKAQRLSVRNETELRGGGSSLGFASPGYGPTVVMSDPVYTIRTWGIYEGGQRLDTVSALDRLDRADLRSRTLDDIKTARRRSRIWFTAAGVGGAAIIGGLVGLRTSDTTPEKLLYSQMTSGGTLLGITGLVVGSFPSAKANRLQRYPSAVLTPEDAREAAAERNEQLRQELGLTPQEVWLMEMGADE